MYRLQLNTDLERKPLLGKSQKSNLKLQFGQDEDESSGRRLRIEKYLLENYDPHAHRKVEHPTSNIDTMIHLLKGNIGTGILAMPEAFKNAGLYLGLIGTMLMGSVCTHSMLMLLNCTNHLCRKRTKTSMDYAEVCYNAFAIQTNGLQKLATFAKYTIDVFLFLSQLGFCCVYILFVARNLQDMMTHYYDVIDIRIYLLALLLPLLGLTFLKNLKYLAPVSLLASILTVISIVIVFYYILHDIPPSYTRPKAAPLMNLPLFFGTAVYAFEGIGMVLPLENNMRTPQDFGGLTGVLNTGMVIVAAMYTAVGFFGYLKYGDSIAASITLNLDPRDFSAELVRLMFAIAIFLSYCLQFYIPIQIIGPWIQKQFPERYRSTADGVLRTSLVIFTSAVVPKLGPIISLFGAVFSSSLALIFPPIIDILTFGLDEMGTYYWKLWKNIAIMIFGIVGFIFGSYVSFLELIQPEPLSNKH